MRGAAVAGSAVAPTGPAAGGGRTLRSAPSLAFAVTLALTWWFLGLRIPAVEPLAADVDSSWRWAINHLTPTLGWGRDVAFTYGPLGWILKPLDSGDHLRLSHLAFAAAILAVAAWVAERVVRFGAPVADALLPLALVLAGERLGLEPDGLVFLVVALLAASARGEPIAWIRSVRAFTVGALCGALPLVKFNLGTGALATLLLVFAARSASREGVVATTAGWAAATTCALAAFARPGDVVAFLRFSWEIARGFSAGLSTPARPADLALAVGLAAMILGALAALYRRRRTEEAWILAVALAPLLFFEFKHGFVRAWNRAPAFFAFAATAAAFAPLAAGSAGARRAARALALASLAAAVASAQLHDRGVTPLRFLPSLERSRDDLRRIFDGDRLARERRALEEGWRQASADLALPADWLAAIKAPGARVSVLPWRLALCPANGLSCVPPPTLQLYTAYTPALDDWTAAWLARTGPDFLLVHFPETQQRHFYSSAPATWRAVRGHYRVRAELPDRSLLLLERGAGARVPPRAERLRPRLGEWVEVPAGGSATRIDGGLEPTPVGALLELLFQLPQPELELELAGGVVRRRRVVAALVGQGFDPADAPGDFAELASSLRGEPVARPERFRLFAPWRRWAQ